MRSIAVLLLLFSLTVFTGAQIKKPAPPPVKVPFTKSLQAVVVTTDDWSSITGNAQLMERKDLKSKWKRVGERFPVVVGRSGLAWGDTDIQPVAAVKYKKEGDGNAPAGMFPIMAAFGTAVKPDAVELPYTKLDQYTECVDDVRSNHYNRIVNRMQVGAFDWKSSEKMLSVGEEYTLGAFVAYNSYPVERGRGSCIFLHVWKSPTEATSGCTAMERRNIERIVGWLSSEKSPYLIQLPSDEYKRHRKTWKLPKVK